MMDTVDFSEVYVSAKKTVSLSLSYIMCTHIHTHTHRAHSTYATHTT